MTRFARKTRPSRKRNAKRISPNATATSAKSRKSGYGRIAELKRAVEAENARLAKIQEHGSFLSEEVTEEHISKIVANWTGVPVERLLEGEMQRLIDMEKRLAERVVGQEDGLRVVSDAVRRARAGAQGPEPAHRLVPLPRADGRRQDRARPRARRTALRRRKRHDSHRYVRIHGKTRRGAADRRAPGYVGYEEGGQLTEAVRRRPYSVILLDEIEKAHPDVFNVLLQLLDDGRLTDSQGRTVDFKNTVVIMTSNLGSEVWGAGGSRVDDAKLEAVNALLRQHFRPEFLNRIDDTVVFHPLDRAHIRRIVDIQLRQLSGRLRERELSIELTDAARDRLAEEGFDPAYGARPLKRAIQRRILDPLAIRLLEGA